MYAPSCVRVRYNAYVSASIRGGPEEIEEIEFGERRLPCTALTDGWIGSTRW
jgi:hypothetical protein